MKRLFTALFLPLVFCLAYACKPDNGNDLHPIDPDPVTPPLYADTVSGQYFRFTLKDSTVIYRQPGADSLSWGGNGYGLSLWASAKNLAAFYDVNFAVGESVPDTLGSFRGYVGISSLNGTQDYDYYEDSITYIITKAKNDTLEGYMKGPLHKNKTTDTVSFKADFRLFAQPR